MEEVEEEGNGSSIELTERAAWKGGVEVDDTASPASSLFILFAPPA